MNGEVGIQIVSGITYMPRLECPNCSYENTTDYWGHICNTCKGNEYESNCQHELKNPHQYCSHLSDDADHKWHYTRAE